MKKNITAMNNSIKILAVIAGAIGAAAIITRKRADGTSLFDDISDAGRSWGDRLVQYGTQLKDRLMPEMKGPNGESVFSDMYDRHYYMDGSDQRVYTDA
ncbi:hypothetical protein GZH53_16350 [Flavihumibacter sp. R14]|nr:hypothetical protein [Flavihumibacter soli]